MLKIPVTFGFSTHSPAKLTMALLGCSSPLSAAKAGCSVAVCHSLCGLCQSQKSHFPPPPRESEECQFLFTQPWPLCWHTRHVLTAGHALTAAAGQVGEWPPSCSHCIFYCYFSDNKGQTSFRQWLKQGDDVIHSTASSLTHKITAQSRLQELLIYRNLI